MYTKDQREFFRWVNEVFADRQICKLLFRLLWHIIHCVLCVGYWVVSIALFLESYVVYSGLFSKYNTLDLNKLRYLAIVVESEEAHKTREVVELLRWLGVVGVKFVCLYDNKGMLKESKEFILDQLPNATLLEVTDENDKLLGRNKLTLEFCSYSDGREGVTKAANVLYDNYNDPGHSVGDKSEHLFTEPKMAEALRRVGYGGPDIDLLLIYGPQRCLLGFPAWRLRYTEIMHMGQLKSKQYGSLVKAIYKFVKVHQNYGAEPEILPRGATL